MLAPVKLAEGVHWVGVNDRTTELFENLWPLPHGISYNAYVVEGTEKIALIDAVKGLFVPDYLDALERLLGPDRRPDYLVVNHLEPDHSGALGAVRARFPGIRVVGNRKTAEFLEHLHGVCDGVIVVGDGDVLDLGGRQLRFGLVPMVHWPETMVTLDTGSGVLFTGDVFGGYRALEGALFDDETHVPARVEGEMLRYFANIVGKYSPMVQKALPKVRALGPRMLAPSHGVVWRGAVDQVVGLYDRWSRHDTDPGVTIAYGSMYGGGERLAERLSRALREAGVATVRVHNLARSHASYVLRDVWRYRALVIGTPTYNLGVFPAVDALLRLLEDKRLERRLLGITGTYGWSGGGVKGVRAFGERSPGWEVVEPVVEARFTPKAEHFRQVEDLARNLAARLEG